MPDSPQNPPPQRRVEFLVFPGVQLLDVTGPLQVFASANDRARERGEVLPYLLRVVAAKGGPIASSSGLALVAEGLPAADVPVDTLIVPGGDGTRAAYRDASLVNWIAVRSVVTRRVASVCSGAFMLAAAGLLDGRRATTHWAVCDLLARLFPAVIVDRDPIYIAEGAVWTSAGITAGIDMALAMLEADLGHAEAVAVARHLVVFAKRPGGQAQFSTGLALAGTEATFESLHTWVRKNLRGDLSVPALARQAGMSERGFERHYKRVTGMTPARAVERMRVEAARQALGDAGASVKRIARDCGFGSEETMRRGFQRVLAVSPTAYRERFPV